MHPRRDNRFSPSRQRLDGRPRVAPLIFVALLWAEPAPAQQSNLSLENRIVISIPDLENQGGLDDQEVTQISEFLRTRFIQNSVFEVVERDRVGDILDEQEFQDTGLTATESAIEYGRLSNASQLLLGSVGELFDRVVVSVRLVNVETGQIAMADTQFTPRESVFDAVTALAARISDTAMDLNRVIDVRLIEERVAAREFSRARELLDIYVRQHGTNDDVRSLLERIRPELYQEYMATANRARRNTDFTLARQQIGWAIAVEPTAEAYSLRERIIREENLFSERQRELQRIAEVRASRAQEAMLNEMADAPIISVSDYYSRIRVTGHRLGACTTWSYTGVPSGVPTIDSGGVAYIGVFSASDADGEIVAAVPVGYISANMIYIPRETSNTGVFDVALSPHLGMAFRVLNLFAIIGLDGGTRIEFDGSAPGGAIVDLTAGATVTAELRFLDRLGIYASLRVAPRLQIPGFVISNWDAYGATGMVFR